MRIFSRFLDAENFQGLVLGRGRKREVAGVGQYLPRLHNLVDLFLKLDVQVFDDKLAKSTQQEQYLADREGVGFNLPKILPLICFPDGIS